MSALEPKYFPLENFKGSSSELSPKLCSCAIVTDSPDAGLWWSAVLALLFPPKEKTKFTSRFKKLIEKIDAIPDVEPEDVEHLYDFLKQYNPFLNRQQCFDNEVLKKLVMGLKRRVESESGDIPCIELQVLLGVACHLLHCDIALCDIHHSCIEVFHLSQDNKSSEEVLTLYFESGVNDSPVFHFGIGEDLAIELHQKAILAEILRAANFSEQRIVKISTSISFNDNIPLNLVENNMPKAITQLYKQPYTLLRLEEAGYDVHPFALGHNGESAFSLSTENINSRVIVYTFYTYLSSTERNPTPYLRKQLVKAAYVLKRNRTIFMARNRKSTVRCIDQLIKFNKVRSSVFKRFTKINKKFTTLSACDELTEVTRRKEKVIETLTLYIKNFNFKDSAKIQQFDRESHAIIQLATEAMQLESHPLYVEKLDETAALLLFDNLFFLKHKLRHNSRDLSAFEKLESTYLLFLFTCEIYGFSQLLYPSSSESETQGSHGRQLRLIIHKSFLHNVILQRRDLLRNIEEFRLHITSRSTDLAEKTQYFSTLKSVPMIHDVILLRTILRYLSNAFNTRCSNTLESKHITAEITHLVTERLLQVIGEYLKECSIGDVTLVKSLLMSSFFPEVRNVFCTTRDTLVHVTEVTNAQNRLIIERKAEIFEGIRDELKRFMSRCKEFLEILEFLMAEDILLRNKSFHVTLSKFYNEHFGKGDQQGNKSVDNSYTEEMLNTLETIRHQIENQIHIDQKEKPEALERIRFKLRGMEFFGSPCKRHLEVHFMYIENYINKARDQPRMGQAYCKSIYFYLRCMKILLLQCIQIFTQKSGIIKRKTNQLTATLRAIKQIAERYIKQCHSSEEKVRNHEETAASERKKIQEEKSRIQEEIEAYEKGKLQEENTASEQVRTEEEKVASGQIRTEEEKAVLEQVRIQELKAALEKIKIQEKKATLEKERIKEEKKALKRRRIQEGKAALEKIRIQEKRLLTFYDNICNKSSTSENSKQAFTCIAKFSESLRMYSPLSENDKALIIGKVPRKFIEHSEAKSKLTSMSEQISNGQDVPVEAVWSEIQKLLPSPNKQRLEWFCNNLDLKICPSDINKVKDPYATLKSNLDNNKLIKKGDYTDYCSVFEWSEQENARCLLQRFVSGDPFKTKDYVIELQKTVHLRFFRERVESLEKLLIQSNHEIYRLWSQAESPKEKRNVQILIVQKFLSDTRLQAATEILLFDCMSSQQNDVHLKDLWMKTSHLFSGINLRNVLAHKDPLIEELGMMLDPDDLATEIVRKCLGLIEKKKSAEINAPSNENE